MDFFEDYGDESEYSGEDSEDEDELYEDCGWKLIWGYASELAPEPCYLCEYGSKPIHYHATTGVFACVNCLRSLGLNKVIRFAEMQTKSDAFAMELRKKKDEKVHTLKPISKNNNNNNNNIKTQNGDIAPVMSAPQPPLNPASDNATAPIQPSTPAPTTNNNNKINNNTNDIIRAQPNTPNPLSKNDASLNASHQPPNELNQPPITPSSNAAHLLSNKPNLAPIKPKPTSKNNNNNNNNIKILTGDIAPATPAPLPSLKPTSDNTTPPTPSPPSTSDDIPTPITTPPPMSLNKKMRNKDAKAQVNNNINNNKDGALNKCTLPCVTSDPILNNHHPPSNTSDPTSNKPIAPSGPPLIPSKPTPNKDRANKCHPPTITSDLPSYKTNASSDTSFTPSDPTSNPPSLAAPTPSKPTPSNPPLAASYLHLKMPMIKYKYLQRMPWYDELYHSGILCLDDDESLNIPYQPPTPDGLTLNTSSPPSVEPNPSSNTEILKTEPPSNKDESLQSQPQSISSDLPSNTINAPSVTIFKPTDPPPNKDGALNTIKPPSITSDPPSHKPNAPSVTALNPSKPTPNNDGTLNIIYLSTKTSDPLLNTVTAPSDTTLNTSKPTPYNDGVLNIIYVSDLPLNKANDPSINTPDLSSKPILKPASNPTSNKDEIFNTHPTSNPPSISSDPSSNKSITPLVPSLNQSKPTPNNDGVLNISHPLLNTSDLPSNKVIAPSVTILNQSKPTPNKDGASNKCQPSSVSSDLPSNKINAPSVLSVLILLSKILNLFLDILKSIILSKSTLNNGAALNVSNLSSNILHLPSNISYSLLAAPTPSNVPDLPSNTSELTSNAPNPPSNVSNPSLITLNPPSIVLRSLLNTLQPPSNTPDPPPNTSLDYVKLLLAFAPPSKPPERIKKLGENDIDPRDRDKYKMDIIGKYGSDGGIMDPRDRDKNKMNTMGEYGLSGGGADPRDRDKKIGLAGTVDTVSLNQLNQANAESLARIVNYGSDIVEAVSLVISYGICGTEPRKNDAVDAVSIIQNMFNYYYYFIWCLIAVLNKFFVAEQVASLYAIAALTKADGWYQMNDDEIKYITYDSTGYGLNSSGDKIGNVIGLDFELNSDQEKIN